MVQGPYGLVERGQGEPIEACDALSMALGPHILLDLEISDFRQVTGASIILHSIHLPTPVHLRSNM
jgi:hypothetical protein